MSWIVLENTYLNKWGDLYSTYKLLAISDKHFLDSSNSSVQIVTTNIGPMKTLLQRTHRQEESVTDHITSKGIAIDI